MTETRSTPFPTIDARPDAPVGSVTHLSSYGSELFPPDVAILCRNSAPLVEFAFGLLRRNVPCNILGRDIGQGLRTLVEKFGRGSVSDLRTQLDSHLAAETARLTRKGKKELVEALQDKVSCILLFCRNAVSVADILSKIDSLFVQAPTQRVTLSTIHKSKGLEWETVYLLDWHLIPSKYAEREWELTQERNLQYVAVTRAKLNLKFIRSGNWK